jgi:hypothetical protein
MPPSDRPTIPTAENLDRRRNPRLRELVDEMLASIRAAANAQLWSPEERERYEADMARIMESVRSQAFGPPAARARLE